MRLPIFAIGFGALTACAQLPSPIPIPPPLPKMASEQNPTGHSLVCHENATCNVFTNQGGDIVNGMPPAAVLPSAPADAGDACADGSGGLPYLDPLEDFASRYPNDDRAEILYNFCHMEDK